MTGKVDPDGTWTQNVNTDEIESILYQRMFILNDEVLKKREKKLNIPQAIVLNNKIKLRSLIYNKKIVENISYVNETLANAT